MADFAMCFPGQESQAVGMLADLAAQHPQVEETFQEANDTLGWDLAKLVREGPAEELDRTERAQPALVAAGMAVWRVWQAAGGGLPQAMVGHSLGEYTALVAAGALDFADGLRLSAARASAMQSAAPVGEGTMGVIVGFDDATVASLCVDGAEGEVVAPANYNAPGQVVIAGAAAAVERTLALAEKEGARLARRLAVSVPSHSVLMRPAAERLRAKLCEIELRMPTVPVLHNVDARPRDDVEGLRNALVEQLEQPVLWSQCVEALRADGISVMLECGPGHVLTGLVRRIDRKINSFALQDGYGLSAGLCAAAA